MREGGLSTPSAEAVAGGRPTGYFLASGYFLRGPMRVTNGFLAKLLSPLRDGIPHFLVNGSDASSNLCALAPLMRTVAKTPGAWRAVLDLPERVDGYTAIGDE